MKIKRTYESPCTICGHEGYHLNVNDKIVICQDCADEIATKISRPKPAPPVNRDGKWHRLHRLFLTDSFVEALVDKHSAVTMPEGVRVVDGVDVDFMDPRADIVLTYGYEYGQDEHHASVRVLIAPTFDCNGYAPLIEWLRGSVECHHLILSENYVGGPEMEDTRKLFTTMGAPIIFEWEV